jgi:hypothetical protein
MNTKFTITRDQLNQLKEKNKLYSYIYSSFTKAFFKISENRFIFMLRGNNGVLQTSLSIDFTGEPVYYSIEYNKWQTVLQKYSESEKIDFVISKNTLKITANEDPDLINLSLNIYSPDSNEAIIIDDFIRTKREEVIQDNKCLTLNEELLSNLNFVDSLFTTQGRVNSVGLGIDSIVYSDRALVVKSYLSENFPEELFSSLSDGSGSYIYLHTAIIKLLPLLYRTNTNIYFSRDYNILYWSDDDTEIYIASPDREVVLPTEEEFKNIQPPSGSPTFSIDSGVLSNCLEFFDGFYEGSAWKPITFNINANKDISLYYKHPTTEITKILPGAVCNTDGSFTIDSEMLKKIINRVKDSDAEEKVNITFDEDAPGVYLSAGTVDYEAVFSKLSGE